MVRIWFLVLAVTLGGCVFFSSPYDCMECWLIREDAIRPFATRADIFYVQSSLYTSVEKVPLMHAYAQSEVGRGRFNGVARVFAPLIASEKNLEAALDWYLSHHHERKRPLVFIGEGTGGAWLRKYEKEHAESLKDAGLVASFYTDGTHKGFVTGEMVKQIKAAIVRAHYQSVWGREMPAGMQD